METTWGDYYEMADGAHYTIGGLIAAVLGWLAEHLRIKARGGRDESPTVREWRATQQDLLTAISAVELGLAAIKGTLISADLPEMKRTIAEYGAEIRAIKTTQMEIREEAGDLEREAHARMDRMERRFKEEKNC